MTRLTLHLLPPSPNNKKVLLALKLKGLDFDTVLYNGFDGREAIVEATGQPLTPVLEDDGKRVYDSYGIMRYLDANFGGPKLYASTRGGMREIERWEDLARNGIAPLMGLVLGMAIEGKVDADRAALANRTLNQLAVRIEDALQNSPYLMGDEPNAADLTLAPFVGPATVDPEKLDKGTLFRFVAENLRLSARFAKTHAWVERVMAIDREPAKV
ncbi:MAG: glutathione S-transferase family protein [Planctomycetota bacterium]